MELPRVSCQPKQYDYLLKFLLVGDSDVGKQEILSGLEDGSSESPFCSGSGKLSKSLVSWSDLTASTIVICHISSLQLTKPLPSFWMVNASNFSYGTRLDRDDSVP